MSIWDDPELKFSDEYVKFDNIGDTVTGTVLLIRAHRWDDGSVSPQLLLEVDGVEKSVTAGQVMLKRALATHRPEQGDTVTITLSDIEKRAGGKTLKHFDVNVRRGGAAAPAAAAAPVAAPAAAPAPAAGADAVAAAQELLKAQGLL